MSIIELEKTIILCPTCDKNNCSDFLDSYYSDAKLKGIYKLVRCNNCGTLYINPRSKKTDLTMFYSADYSLPIKQSSTIFTLIKEAVYQFYCYLRKYNIFKLFCKHIINKLRVRYEVDLGIVNLERSSTILEIGSGNGKFLDYLQWLTDCKVTGVEINRDAAITANKLLGNNEVFNKSFEEQSFANESFDLVVMWFLFEHFIDPNSVLNKIYKLLKKDGWLVMSIPNINSFDRIIFGKDWYTFDLLRHLQYFNIKTITLLLKKHGFIVKKTKFDYNPYDFTKSLQMKFSPIKNIIEKRENIRKVQPNILGILIALPLCIIEAFLCLSGTIIIYAKKELK